MRRVDSGAVVRDGEEGSEMVKRGASEEGKGVDAAVRVALSAEGEEM